MSRRLPAERRAKIEAQLDCPPFPLELEYLWVAFCRLSSRRASSGFGLAPISWADIDAFCRHSGLRLTPFDIGVIEHLDNLFRQQRATRTEE